MNHPPVVMEADSRTKSFGTATFENLKTVSAGWELPENMPPDVAEIFHVSQRMFVQGYFVYDLFTIAAAWSLLGLEAALRERMGEGTSRIGFKRLVEKAVSTGLLEPDEGDQLNTGAELRNMFAHPSGHKVWSPGLAETVLDITHRHVRRLYE